MTDQSRIRFGRGLALTAALLSVTGIGVFVVLGLSRFLVEGFVIHNALLAVGLGSLAWTAIPAQPRNGAIWALAWSSFFGGLFVGSAGTTMILARAHTPDFTLDVIEGLSPADLPLAGALALQPLFWSYIPAFMLVLTLGLLLFPDGQFLSPRWRWVGWFSVAAMAVAVAASAIKVRPTSTVPLDSFEGFFGSVVTAAINLGTLGALISIVSVVIRYRRSSGIARLQIRWIAWGGSFLIAILLVSNLLEGVAASGASLTSLLTLVGGGLFILSFWIAISKYRLYDIDVVISRTVSYGFLAAFITSVYVAVVVGLGSLIGQSDEPNLALAIGATAVVALLFEPVRSRVQGFANRFVYGERATPYEVLSQLTVRLADTQSSEQVLSQIATLIATGTGANQSVVWLRVGNRLRPESVAPDGSSVDMTAVPLEVNDLPGLPGDASVAITHSDELLGALTISKHRADAVTPADASLLEDVAAGSALLLRNLRLNAELAERAEQVRASRRRLIAAHDAERHRLERDLHDGAQQQVVALKVKLGLAQAIAEQEGADELASVVSTLADDTQNAVDQMRDLAHGIYPPLLEAEGLGAALTAARRSAAIPVELDIDNIGRYSRQVEETTYFGVTELIGQGVMAGATRADVTVHSDHSALTFTVSYDAPAGGLDRSTLADRIDAAEGTVDQQSSSGGTTVTVRFPAQVMEPA